MLLISSQRVTSMNFTSLEPHVNWCQQLNCNLYLCTEAVVAVPSLGRAPTVSANHFHWLFFFHVKSVYDWAWVSLSQCLWSVCAENAWVVLDYLYAWWMIDSWMDGHSLDSKKITDTECYWPCKMGKVFWWMKKQRKKGKSKLSEVFYDPKY